MEHPKSTFKIHSCFRDGTLPAWIEVEIHACFQIPGLQILGLPAPEIREAKERILAAFPASGFEFPRKKVTINLAPSSIPKWGTAHDLPIALRILSLVEALPPGPPVLANGELGLDGGVRSTGSPALLMELLLNDPRPDGFRVILAEDDHRAYLNLIRWRQQRSLPLPRNTRVFRISHFSQIRKVLSETDSPVLPAPTADERPRERNATTVAHPHLLGSFGPKGYRAGELALSHGGFLFADEFMEWSRDSKESLREPLEARSFRLTRVQGSVEVPCDLQLVATGNLCPCGGLPVELARLIPGSKGNCRCPPGITRAYLSRLSGPILDRIDLPVLLRAESGQNTEKNPEDRIHEAVNKGRKFALEHFGVLPSRISAAGLEADLSNPGIRSLLDAASPSLRFRHKTLRVAKSIQAHEQSTRLEAHHVLEALALRELDTHLGNG